MRGLLVLIALTGVALYWGGQNFFTGLSERSPLEITCGDYLAHHPDNRWLKLTQCEPDLDNMAIEEKDGKVTAAYIPLRAKGTTVGKTEIVLRRTDDDMTKLAKLDTLGPGDEATAKRVIAELEGANEGLVQFGIDLSDKDKKELERLNLGLAADFIIVENGKEPRLLIGGLVFALGLGGLAFFLRGVYKKLRPSAA